MIQKSKLEYRVIFPYLLRLLASVLNNEKPPKPIADTDWASVFYIAELHSVAGMVYYALMKLDPEDRPPADILESFRNHQLEQTVRDANISYETDLLLKELDRQGVRVLPVKGINIKNDYPDPSMRTMTDVDILYDISCRNKVIDIFTSFGYTLIREVDEQLDFVKEPFHHYEMHSWLLSPISRSFEYFADTWSRVKYTNGSTIGKLGVDDTYIYMLEHLAKHFEAGGAGIRLVMDVYVFYRAHGKELNTEYLMGELKKLHLTEFEEIIRNLAFNWFLEDTPQTDSTLADFILCSCTFGTSKNALLQSAIRKEQKTGKKRSGYYHIFRRIFPTYSGICRRFRSAKKLKFLYPFYIPAYWFLRLFKERNVTTANLGYMFESTDSDNAILLRTVIEDLGLKSRM